MARIGVGMSLLCAAGVLVAVLESGGHRAAADGSFDAPAPAPVQAPARRQAPAAAARPKPADVVHGLRDPDRVQRADALIDRLLGKLRKERAARARAHRTQHASTAAGDR
jgi:hypothetical protein